MPAKPTAVLLVEDNPGDARLIELMLAEAGAGRFEWTRTDRLEPALQLLALGRYGVVLLDLSLPDSHGLDTFRTVARQAPQVPVVVLTGMVDETLGEQAVGEGAQDYLRKDQVTAPHLIHALHYAVGRHQRQQVLARARRATEEELAHEMAVARLIYQQLLPKGAPACAGYDIHGASLSATAAGGDFYDYLALGPTGVGLVIGDVTGHGVGPALLMAATRAYLRAFAHTGDDLGTIVARTNRVLVDDLADGRNVTLLLAQLDTGRPALTFTSAGHEPGYVLDRHGQVRAELFSTGLPLGIVAEGNYAAGQPLALQAGDVVLLLTDGVVEARNPERKMFGRPRALDVARRHRHQSATEIIQALYDTVRDFTSDRPAQDDMTAIAIKVGVA
jgi:serine phosphatase RsbU (regulator of sigma subunit)